MGGFFVCLFLISQCKSLKNAVFFFSFKTEAVLETQDFLPQVQKMDSDVHYTPACKNNIWYHSVNYLVLQNAVKHQMH